MDHRMTDQIWTTLEKAFSSSLDHVAFMVFPNTNVAEKYGQVSVVPLAGPRGGWTSSVDFSPVHSMYGSEKVVQRNVRILEDVLRGFRDPRSDPAVGADVERLKNVRDRLRTALELLDGSERVIRQYPPRLVNDFRVVCEQWDRRVEKITLYESTQTAIWTEIHALAETCSVKLRFGPLTRTKDQIPCLELNKRTSIYTWESINSKALKIALNELREADRRRPAGLPPQTRREAVKSLDHLQNQLVLADVLGTKGGSFDDILRDVQGSITAQRTMIGDSPTPSEFTSRQEKSTKLRKQQRKQRKRRAAERESQVQAESSETTGNGDKTEQKSLDSAIEKSIKNSKAAGKVSTKMVVRRGKVLVRTTTVAEHKKAKVRQKNEEKALMATYSRTIDPESTPEQREEAFQKLDPEELAKAKYLVNAQAIKDLVPWSDTTKGTLPNAIKQFFRDSQLPLATTKIKKSFAIHEHFLEEPVWAAVLAERAEGRVDFDVVEKTYDDVRDKLTHRKRGLGSELHATVAPPASERKFVLKEIKTPIPIVVVDPEEPGSPPVPIASMAHGLSRVLFSPGVHMLKDPRTGVFNFSPSLESLPKLEEFEFEKLPQYITSSKDETLEKLAREHEKKFVGSTSSTVSMLCHVYFWLSKGAPVNVSMLGAWAQKASTSFTLGQRLPASVILNWKDGHYAIDADKSLDAASDLNPLAQYGHLMEKLLTTEAEEFKGFLKGSKNPARSEADDKQAYHYMTADKLLLRSQLDAHHDLLPNVSFDLKTRASIAVRQDRLNHESAADYHVTRLKGEWRSFEREYYDLIRSAFLKYQFQARIGHMDGCFLAYHSTGRFFGFQYIPIEEMDEALFGSADGSRAAGDRNFAVCLAVLQDVLEAASACYPSQTIKLTFNANTVDVVSLQGDPLRVFVEPVEPDETCPKLTMLELHLRPDMPTPDTAEWQPIKYELEEHTDSTRDVRRKDVAAMFAETQALQQTFNSLYLPVGVSVEDVNTAHMAVSMAQTEPVEPVSEEKAEMAARFPIIPGMTYEDRPPYAIRKIREMTKRDARQQAKKADSEEDEEDKKPIEGSRTALRMGRQEIVLQDQATRLTGRTLMLVFFALQLALFLSFLDSTSVSPALPVIGRELNASESIAWLGTSFLVANTSFQIVTSRLSDIFGRKIVLIGSLGLLILGDLLCGFAKNAVWLYITRGIAGIGGGGINSLCMIIMSDIVSLRDRGKFQGYLGIAISLGSAVGPFAGALFSEKVTWRWTFWVSPPIGAITVVIIWLLLPSKKIEGDLLSKVKQMDWLGTFLALTMTICALVPLSGGGTTFAWTGPVVIALFVVAGVAAIAFVIVQLRFAKLPLLPGRLFTNWNVALVLGQTFLVGMIFYGGIYFTPLYAENVRGYSAIVSAAILLPLVLTQTFTTTISGLVVKKTGRTKSSFLVGFTVWFAGQAAQLCFDRNTPLAVLIVVLFIQGAGAGATLQSTVVLAQASAPAADRAIINGARNFARTSGGAVALAVSNTILNNIFLKNLPSDVPDSLRTSLSKSFDLPDDIPDELRNGILDAYMVGMKDVDVSLDGPAPSVPPTPPPVTDAEKALPPPSPSTSAAGVAGGKAGLSDSTRIGEKA
ncbi:hypothetical protein MNV49_000507 [Pseudohyphozyma bogoriensis]|nr:hypothetical protein MNV49_000507 [Pseudohyphozyma bogoriensis]